jgi:hypothetical protein
MPAAAPQDQQYPQSNDGRVDQRAAVGEIFALGNEARAQAGVPALAWDPALAAAALRHCRMMAAEGPISHQYEGEPELTLRAAQAGAHFSVIEENVAFAPSAAAVHQAWMHSPEHRRNLLSPEVNHVGIAVVNARGGFYVVADYSAEVESLSRSQVEARVAGLLRARGVAILSDSALARSACVHDSGWPRSSGARPAWIMRWQSSDLSQLPQALTEQLEAGKRRQAAVGSCPAQNVGGAFTSYRVAVLLY